MPLNVPTISAVLAKLEPEITYNSPSMDMIELYLLKGWKTKLFVSYERNGLLAIGRS